MKLKALVYQQKEWNPLQLSTGFPVFPVENITEEALASWLDHIAEEPDTEQILDMFVKMVEVDGEQLNLYFAFDYWDDDFMPQKKTNPEKGSSNNPMVENRGIEPLTSGLQSPRSPS